MTTTQQDELDDIQENTDSMEEKLEALNNIEANKRAKAIGKAEVQRFATELISELHKKMGISSDGLLYYIIQKLAKEWK